MQYRYREFFKEAALKMEIVLSAEMYVLGIRTYHVNQEI